MIQVLYPSTYKVEPSALFINDQVIYFNIPNVNLGTIYLVLYTIEVNVLTPFGPFEPDLSKNYIYHSAVGPYGNVLEKTKYQPHLY